MKWFLWAASVGLASLGGLLLLLSLTLVSNPQANQEDRDGSLALFVFAVPPLVGGTGLAWGLYFHQRNAERLRQQAEVEQLQKLFYDLVQRQQGRLTVLQFAAAANLSGTAAKQYLDERAKEFGADFTSEAAGEVTYHFPV
ncbi:MAG: hypothetical protein ICV62_17985 [Cyanobacteria bacterium Co-bin13]|nr:hypothetical protein [Cyanobacteria bacterium Co-bin13]